MKSEICRLIEDRVSSAIRRGGFTEQDYTHLKKHIVHKHRDGVAEAACSLVRKHGPNSELYWPIQEVVGRLLLDQRPGLLLGLDEVLSMVVDTWNPSVEQLPIYLGQIFGVEAVRAKLAEMGKAPLSSHALESVKTMDWWLRGSLKDGYQR